MPRTLCRDCWEIFASGPGACPGCLSERLVTHAELEDLCIAHVDCDAFYVQVARLLEAGYLEPEICRRLSPTHSLRSVEHYAQLYKNMLKLLEQGFAPAEISSILSLNRSLLNEYIQIVKEHHPEVLQRNGHL